VLATAFDVFAAYLIARSLGKWWLPVSFLAGAAIGITFSLGMAALDLVGPGESVVNALRTVPAHGVFTVLCAWAFSRSTS
jgi:hypothetical protein